MKEKRAAKMNPGEEKNRRGESENFEPRMESGKLTRASRYGLAS